MLLVVWAASFCLDVRGVEDNNGLNLDQGPPSSLSPDSMNANLKTSASTSRNSRRHGLPGSENLSRNLKINDEARRERRERVNVMVNEVLHFVDVYGIMRRPTWDGVKVLLLAWPLTEGTAIYSTDASNYLADSLLSRYPQRRTTWLDRICTDQASRKSSYYVQLPLR